MKKFLVMAVMAIMSLGASAQWYAGGSLSYTHSKATVEEDGEVYDVKGDKFTIAPELGYNLSENWAVGAALNYTWVKDAYNQFAINPYARYTYLRTELVSLFVDGGFGIGVFNPKEGDSTTIWSIGLKPGISLNFTERFSLVAHMGFLGYQDYDTRKVYGLNFDNNLSFGFYYNF